MREAEVVMVSCSQHKDGGDTEVLGDHVTQQVHHHAWNLCTEYTADSMKRVPPVAPPAEMNFKM